MGSDRARVSYDANQQYRAVVAQQGRVTLDADWNDAQQIASEEQREFLLDIVGPTGTPDDGYRILETGSVPTPPFDFSIQQGTMYVGGMRAFLPNTTQYSDQSDWLDWQGDPDWVDPATPSDTPEFIYLLLREQEVSAVEDSTLREPALGGPDTTQRTRLIQRIMRLSTEGKTCETALDLAQKRWLTQGLRFDAQTMRLMAVTTLQVGFLDSATPSDLCDPEARGGYLGAENQLIRVKISAVDGANNQYKLVWGFDNASFLYRVTVTSSTTLTLQSQPVDDFHRPQTSQAVEVLRSAARLSNKEYVAAATGSVTTLTVPYNPDTQAVTLPAPLLAEYLDADQTPQLFLRVWEEELLFTPGTPVSLGKTGLQVTLDLPGGQSFHLGDYWFFAVRPTTPTAVYPQRYLDAPQPPEGPRLWVCPLAVIDIVGAAARIIKVLEDCRHPFDNLIELTKRRGSGCCTVAVKPEDLRGNVTLQSIVDRFANRDRVTICLMPGTYSLPEPLVIGPENTNLTLEGCHDGVVLEAAPGKEANFVQGLIVLNRANSITLRRLRFQMPQVPFFEVGGTIAGLSVDQIARFFPRLRDLRVSIGLRPLHCALLTIEECLFRYELTKGADGFGVGIFAGSECWGLAVKNCRFLHDEDYLQNLQEPLRMLVGYLLAPSLSLRSLPNPSAISVPTPSGSLLRSLLQDACFENNIFAGLTFATLIMADTGIVRSENNTVRDCYSGFWLLTLRALSVRDEELQSVATTENDDSSNFVVPKILLQLIHEPVTYLVILLAQSYPLPSVFNPREAITVPKATIRSLSPPRVLDRVVEHANAVLGSTVDAALNLAIPGLEITNVSLNLANLATVETMGFAKALGDRLELLKRLALQQLVKLPLQLSLDFSQNTVETLPPNAPSGVPLFIWDTDQQTQSLMTMSGNRIRNRNFAQYNPNAGQLSTTPLPTALILQVDRCTVTGNLVLNEAVLSLNEQGQLKTFFFSFVLLPGEVAPDMSKRFGPPVAITGNVFKGFPLLPPRPSDIPAPLNVWSPIFNTQTW